MKFLVVIFIFIFAGCSVTTPHIAEYRINVKVDKAQYMSKKCKSKSLKVMQSFSSNSLMSKEMKYAQDNYEEFSFTESEWAQSPNKAINEEILKVIRDSTIFESVSGYRSRSKNDLTLEVNVENFMQYFTNNNTKSFVSVVLYMSLIDNKSSKIISAKRVSQILNITKLNAIGGVDALNKALSNALIDTNKWLDGTCK